MPVYPFSTSMSEVSKFCPLTEVNGKNVALPAFFFLRYSIASSAVFSFSTTIFCTAFPSAVWTAVAYSDLTVMSCETVPRISVCFLPYLRTAFTPVEKPSIVFSSSPRILSLCFVSLSSFSSCRTSFFACSYSSVNSLFLLHICV